MIAEAVRALHRLRPLLNTPPSTLYLEQTAARGLADHVVPHPELDWLYSTQLYGIKLGLENVHKLLGALGLPGQGTKFIHVAGTNGKGSTCAFMHAILKQAGIKAGLFTSPHLIRFNERIRDAEREITDAEIEAGLAKLRVLVAGWQPHPTFFELALALALDWFAQRQVEWVILETGLGGRLDATNALTPEVAVITRIGMDHREQLGDTVAKIAAEKAGIIKPGVPVLTAQQPKEALEVIRQTAKAQRAELNVIGRALTEVPLGLAGAHQGWNAALAVEALKEAGVRIPAVIVEAGLAQVKWSGRFQNVGGLIVDGAHNEDAAQVLVATWRQHFPGQKAAVIFGAARDKDVGAVMRALAPIVGEWCFTASRSPRSLPPERLMEVWGEVAEKKVPVRSAPGIEKALDLPCSHPRLVAGSLYLVGETLALLAGQTGGFQVSAQ